MSTIIQESLEVDEDIINHLEFSFVERNKGFYVIACRNKNRRNIDKNWKHIENSTYSKPGLTKLKDDLSNFLHNSKETKEEKVSDLKFKCVEKDKGYFEIYIKKTQKSNDESWNPINYDTFLKTDLTNLRDYIVEFLKD